MQTDMNFYVKLVGISSFLEQQANLDDSLNEFVAMAANILNTENCSIMLFREGEEPGDFRLRVFAQTGNLPDNALQEAAKVSEGIAGRVAATGQALLVEDITRSPYLPLARAPEGPSKCFMSVPVMIGTKVVGVINASNPRDGRCFNGDDLTLATFMTLLVGKSIQVVQLQNILRSRFAQMAISRDTKNLVASKVNEYYQDPSRLAKIAAKTFYREMTRAGLGTGHILNAATEIVGLLGDSLKKHKRRAGGVQTSATPDTAPPAP
ncbi:MAG: GAF domain-containing protein [Desulfuromonadales bacterium]|nr:MAG: GAF domain-containing protein [Desulfuromonadales bacterium]